MKPSLSDLLGPPDGADPSDPGDDKPTIGDALGEAQPDDGADGGDATDEAKADAGTKLLQAFESKDPKAMFDAVAGVVALNGLGS